MASHDACQGRYIHPCLRYINIACAALRPIKSVTFFSEYWQEKTTLLKKTGQHYPQSSTPLVSSEKTTWAHPKNLQKSTPPGIYQL